MKTISLYLTVLLAFLLSFSFALGQTTMTFSSGASHSGFSFSGFNSGGGTIWIANLGGTPGRITKSSGTWNVTSVLLGTPVAGSGGDAFTITSNLGHSRSYTGATKSTVTLNWSGVTWIQFHRTSSSGTSPDIDNVIYTVSASFTNPTVPTLTYSPLTVCSGSSATLNISGTLNDATAWHVYTGSCGTSSNQSVTINALDDASFSYSTSSYCSDASDPSPTITGLSGGSFSSTAGLSIASNGTIDVSASIPNIYSVTYTEEALKR